MPEHTSFVMRTQTERSGDDIRLTVIVELPDGTHLEPHVPVAPELIPTDLHVTGLRDAHVAYPDAVDVDLGWRGATLRVLRGVLPFIVTGRLESDTARISGTLRYQPCVGGACLPPRTVSWQAPLTGPSAYSVLDALAPAGPPQRATRKLKIDVSNRL